MHYDSSQPRLLDALSLPLNRQQQLKDLFLIATQSLPADFLPSELHARVAPYLHTTADAYLMGSVITDFLHRCRIAQSLNIANPQSAN